MPILTMRGNRKVMVFHIIFWRHVTKLATVATSGPTMASVQVATNIRDMEKDAISAAEEQSVHGELGFMSSSGQQWHPAFKGGSGKMGPAKVKNAEWIFCCAGRKQNEDTQASQSKSGPPKIFEMISQTVSDSDMLGNLGWTNNGKGLKADDLFETPDIAVKKVPRLVFKSKRSSLGYVLRETPMAATLN
jgi:hypothetical protein